MYVSEGESLEGWLLQQTSYSIQPVDSALLVFMVDLINNESKRPIEVSYSVTNIFNQVFQNIQNRAPKAAGVPKAAGAPAASDARLRALYEEVGRALAGRPSSLLVGSLYDRYQNDLKNQSTND